ncbi:site-specific integrase [Schleiferilactobacillus perolens]|uniref:Integrase n=1 Tax=Schleiferilactobacillus perolens DSM 12744 TaxID=1423792 RepID=A0A0R1MXQ7_9LACO|nr:site-specific integrase [Schleiferilactobacillus perolens]KRL12817.1 integrase [Schleiferilactobacillus perolens DSM 12744]
MAEIKKRGKKWQYRVFYTDPDTGNQHSKSKSGFSTKSDAVAAANEIEVQKQRGASLGNTNVLFSEYYDQWIKDTKLGRYSYQTEVWYKRTGKMIHDGFPGVALKDVSRRKYTKFLDNYAADHSKESVAKTAMFIRSMVHDAMSERIIFTDFTSGVKNNGKPGKRESDKYLEESQLKKLTEVVKNHLSISHITAYEILTAIYTGARYEEIAAITWDRIDWNNNRLTLDRAYDYITRTGFKEMKTPNSIRTLDVSPELIHVLHQLHQDQIERYLKKGYRDEDQLVFRSIGMTVPSDGAANKALKQYQCEANIPQTDWITFHGLRHSHASYLLSKGVDISYISKRLGHANIALTLRVYAHLLENRYQQEATKSASLLSLL